MEGLVYCERKKKISVYYANESCSAPCLANNSTIFFRLHQRRKITQGRRRWYFRFFGFGFFLESFSWFCAKQSRRFSVLIFIAVCGFSVSSSMWFSVFVKNTSGFADPISVSFSYFLALISNGRETLKLYRSVSSHGTNSNMLRRAGKCTVGLPKQRQVKVDWYELVWFGSPTL